MPIAYVAMRIDYSSLVQILTKQTFEKRKNPTLLELQNEILDMIKDDEKFSYFFKNSSIAGVATALKSGEIQWPPPSTVTSWALGMVWLASTP